MQSPVPQDIQSVLEAIAVKLVEGYDERLQQLHKDIVLLPNTKVAKENGTLVDTSKNGRLDVTRLFNAHDTIATVENLTVDLVHKVVQKHNKRAKLENSLDPHVQVQFIQYLVPLMLNFIAKVLGKMNEHRKEKKNDTSYFERWDGLVDEIETVLMAQRPQSDDEKMATQKTVMEKHLAFLGGVMLLYFQHAQRFDENLRVSGYSPKNFLNQMRNLFQTELADLQSATIQQRTEVRQTLPTQLTSPSDTKRRRSFREVAFPSPDKQVTSPVARRYSCRLFENMDAIIANSLHESTQSQILALQQKVKSVSSQCTDEAEEKRDMTTALFLETLTYFDVMLSTFNFQGCDLQECVKRLATLTMLEKSLPEFITDCLEYTTYKKRDLPARVEQIVKENSKDVQEELVKAVTLELLNRMNKIHRFCEEQPQISKKLSVEASLQHAKCKLVARTILEVQRIAVNQIFRLNSKENMTPIDKENCKAFMDFATMLDKMYLKIFAARQALEKDDFELSETPDLVIVQVRSGIALLKANIPGNQIVFFGKAFNTPGIFTYSNAYHAVRAIEFRVDVLSQSIEQPQCRQVSELH